MNNDLIVNNNFSDLSFEDEHLINGGIGFAGGVAIGFVVTAAAVGVDRYVERKTGKSIGDHIMDTVSDGFNAVGDFLDNGM